MSSTNGNGLEEKELILTSLPVRQDTGLLEEYVHGEAQPSLISNMFEIAKAGFQKCLESGPVGEEG